MKAFIEEWKLLMSGKSVVIFILTPIIMASVFGYVFKNNQINEAPLAVVDLDHSKYSRELIGKLDASQYISVEGVFDNDIDPDMLLYNERYAAVLYLPAGLERNRTRGVQTNIGFYVDNIVTGAVGTLRSGVSEVITTENAALSTGSLMAMGLSNSAATGMMTSLNLQQRTLYNPTNSTMTTSVVGFVNTAMISLLGSAALTIVPRLREAGRLSEALANPLQLVLRIVPYSLVGCVSFIMSFGILKQVGGMRFEATAFEMFIPFFIYTVLLSLFAMIIGWTAANPAKAGKRTIMIILPSFLLSGANFPVLMLPEPLQFSSKFLPLFWQLEFIRGLAFRGGKLQYFIPQFGEAILLMGGMLAVVYLLVLKERRAEHKLHRSEEKGSLSAPASSQSISL
ncbi:ABC transporter permease [Paenibacillus macerans]|uniref:ABC transporter permease n=1 Tax=Paenibacillus macerans TaxID=44252 RepID=UPI002E1EEA26|nr:ABC transporter permease [Paenibacillus macerans]